MGGDLAAIVLELKNPVYKEFLSLYSRTRAFEGLGDLFFALSDRTIKAGCDIYALILFKGAKKSEAIFGGKFTPADFGDCILVGKYVSKINPKDKDTIIKLITKTDSKHKTLMIWVANNALGKKPKETAR